MATLSEKRERQDRILAELSELGLELARDLQACALAAVEASDKADLSLAFQRSSRSVRQTLALEAKLERDRKAAEREDQDVAKRVATSQIARRRAQVKLVVERCIWSEADGDEAEALLSDLDDFLELDTLSGVYTGDVPFETHVARICKELGVDTPEAFAARRAETPSASPPSTVDEAEPQVEDPPPWRSSG